MNKKITKYASDWLARGDDDLALVKLILEKGSSSPNLACFHAQQAAEKYLKGFLTYHDLHVRKIHDLKTILEDCKNIASSFSEIRESVNFLNQFYSETRYPDDYIAFSMTDAKQGLEAAERIKDFVLKQINAVSPSSGFGTIVILIAVAALALLLGGGWLMKEKGLFSLPAPLGKQCTAEAMLCPDGKTSVSRTGPNCEFAECPSEALCEGVECPDSNATSTRYEILNRTCEPRFVVESGPELTASEAYAGECSKQTSREQCEKVDVYRASTNNFGNSDGIPDCQWVGEVRSDISTWKTYRNEKYGFEVKYNPEVAVKINSQDPLILKIGKDVESSDLAVNKVTLVASTHSQSWAVIKQNHEIEIERCTNDPVSPHCVGPGKSYYYAGAKMEEVNVKGVPALRIKGRFSYVEYVFLDPKNDYAFLIYGAPLVIPVGESPKWNGISPDELITNFSFKK